MGERNGARLEGGIQRRGGRNQDGRNGKHTFHVGSKRCLGASVDTAMAAGLFRELVGGKSGK